jgi:small-conductance mechanosensitive channel
MTSPVHAPSDGTIIPTVDPVSPGVVEQFRSISAYVTEWLHAHSADIAIAAAAGTLLYLALRAGRRLVRNAAKRRADQHGFAATALSVLARTGHFFLAMAAIRLVVGYANPPQFVSDIVRLLFLIAIAFQVAVWVREILMSILRQRSASGGSETLGNALAIINVLVSIALFAVATIVVLDNVGVNVTGLVAGLGIGGIAIGLAAKGVFEDLFAALSIIFDRPFRTGETIGFDGKTATVQRIGLKTTRLRALTGEEVIVSNTNLLNKELLNFAQVSRRRIKLTFGVSYATPPAKLRDLPAIVREIVEPTDKSVIHCGIVGFAASSIDFELHYEDAAEDYASVFAGRHGIGVALVERFAAEGIAFAYPVQIGLTADPDGMLISPHPPA